MAQAGVAYVTIKPDWQGFNRELGRGMPNLNRDVGRIGSGITRQFAGIGKQAAFAFGGAATGAAKVAAAGVGAALVGSIKVAADFEAQLSSLGSVAAASASDMEKLRKSAIKAGADTKFSALEAAKAQTELAKGGLSTAQILSGGLSSALALAAAGELELADAASTTVNSMKLFGLSGKQSIKVANAFATAANSTTADVSDFALALNQTGSAAKTVGLSFPETIAALETLAEVGVKGSDAGTSLKTALVQLASPSSAKAKETASKLGLELFTAEGKMKSLVEVSGELQDSLGNLTDKQRIQAATTLVGQDGFRALLALYEAGPKKVQKLQDELNKEGTAAEVAKKKQDNLKGSLEALGGSVETLGIQVGTAMIPAVRKGADEINDFADKISKIVARDDLDVGEKLSESFRVARVTIRPWLAKLKREVIDADIPDAVGRLMDRITRRLERGVEGGAFADAIGRQIENADLAARFGKLVDAAMPHILTAISTAAKTAAGLFVKAFIGADGWGKLALGAWLMSKMGGVAAFTALGRRAGGAMALGAGSAPGVPGAPGAPGAPASRVGTVKNVVGKAGNSLPIIGTAAVGILALNESQDAEKAEKKAKVLAAAQRELEASLPDPARWQAAENALKRLGPETIGGTEDAWNASTDAIKRLGLSLESTPEQVQAAKGAFDGLKERFEVTQALFAKGIVLPVDVAVEAAKKVESAIERMATGSSTSIKSLRTNVRLNTRLIKTHMDEDTYEGKQALAANFRAAAENAARSFNEAGKTTKEGTEEIERLMVKALGQFGFSKKQALNIIETGDDQGNRGREGGASSAMGKQRGGVLIGGAPSGDSIPAMLERGEYVLNREAVKHAGVRNLDRLNFGAAPRFQTGGIVELLHPFNDPAGHGGSNSHLHVAAATVAQIVALGRKLQSLGWLVGEHPAFGGVNGRHAAGGYHYSSQAIDVNWPDASMEAAKIKALLPMLGSAGPGGGPLDAPDLSRVLVGGPDSPLKSLVQGAVDVARRAAQSVVDSAAGAGFEGAEVVGDASGNGAELMRAISKQRGWNFADWWAIDAKETGHGANLTNPTSTARLRGQFLDFNWGKFGPGSDPRGNPSMAQQIESMAAYIADRYGNPTTALAHHNRNNWYQRGGLVGMLTGGLAGAIKGRAKFAGVDLGGVLKQIRTGRSEKLRGKALADLLGSVKGIQFDHAAGTLSRLAGEVNLFGDYADRAGQLTDTGAISEALQNEMTRRGGNFPAQEQQTLVDSMLARVNGGTQLEWLSRQIGSMFDWRNELVDTAPWVQHLRDQTAQLLTQAQERLAALVKEIETTQKKIERLQREREQVSTREDTLEDRIRGEMDKPAKKRDPKKLGAWRAELAEKHARHVEINARLSALRGVQRGRERERDALEGDGGIVSALSDKRDSLASSFDDITDNITSVQGIGSPMSRLTVLPPVGVLGGKLFDTQKLIGELTNNPPRVQASVGQQSDGDSQSAQILKDLLNQANLRTLVSERAFDVFNGMPAFGGSFATGGIVPGPVGAARTIIAHGGEEVIPVGGDGPQVRVVVEDNRVRVFVDDIEQVVDRVVRRQTRTGARGLPGLGGGMNR